MDYYDRELPFDAHKVVEYLVRNTFRILAIDKETLDNTIEQAFRFSESGQLSEIRFLI